MEQKNELLPCAWIHECENGTQVFENEKDALYKINRWGGSVSPLYKLRTPPAQDGGDDLVLLEVLNFISYAESLKIGGFDGNPKLEREDIRERAKALYAKLEAMKWGLTNPVPDGMVLVPVSQIKSAIETGKNLGLNNVEQKALLGEILYDKAMIAAAREGEE